MARLYSAFITLCRIGTGAAFLVLIGAVLTQVVGRSILNDSPPWTEELTRYAMLWMIAFGVGLSLRTGDLVNVDILCESLPGRWPWRLRLVSAIAMTGLCAVLIWPAWRFTAIGARQTSPVLKISMNYVHGSVMVLLILLTLFAFFRVSGMLAGTTDGRPVPNPDRQT